MHFLVCVGPPSLSPASLPCLPAGFSTAKGGMVRSILFPKPLNLKFYSDALKFVFGMAILGKPRFDPGWGMGKKFPLLPSNHPPELSNYDVISFPSSFPSLLPNT